MTAPRPRPITLPLQLLAALVALALAALASGPAPAGAAGPYGPEYRSCGTFRATYKIHVYETNTTCRRARRIQKEYWLAPERRKVAVNGGYGADGYFRLKRFPGWRCSSGSGGGACIKGEMVAAYQN